MQLEDSRQVLSQKISETIARQDWRLNNLYVVEDKQGRVVRFEMNSAQSQLYDTLWYLNVILKARQLGFSTFIAMFFLDVCVFNSNTRCGIVDATIDDAKKKLGKIKLAYDNLPKWLKDARPISQANAFKIEWANGSSVEVGTSHRGGTLQYLHISELGKIAAKYPEKAREIRTGALNTIQSGQMCFIESTAEGQDGDFYSLCQESEAKARMRSELTPLDFKFHFFPWWQASEYAMNDQVPIPIEMERYFEKLEKDSNIKLNRQQKVWYVKKAEIQRDDMKREFPSTPKEAFEASIEGAIFGPQIAAIEAQGKVGKFPVEASVPVHTFWDIGRSDYTSIWFAQVLFSRLRVIGFYQNCMLELPHYTEFCFGTARAKKAFPEHVFGEDRIGIYEEKGWEVGYAYFPHDMAVTEFGSGRSRFEQAVKAGFKPKRATDMSLHDGINAARATLAYCEFDQEGCSEGLKMLKSYRWEWDDIRGVWRTGTPRHGIESHGSDSFRYLSTSWREIVPSVVLPPKPIETRMPTLDELVKMNKLGARKDDRIR